MKFMPVFPIITVTEVTDLNTVRQIAQDMKDNQADYVGITWLGVNPHAMRVRGGEVEGRFFAAIRDRDGGYENVVVKIGDFLVESANGKKTIVHDQAILGGNFEEVSYELFIPIRGTSLKGLQNG